MVEEAELANYLGIENPICDGKEASDNMMNNNIANLINNISK